MDAGGVRVSDDDRVYCTDCRAYAARTQEVRLDDGMPYTAKRGDCLQAATGRRLDVWRHYGPADVDLPRRCAHFLPFRDAVDQRTGRERFPVLYAEYEAAIAAKSGDRRAAAQRGIERAKSALANTS